MNKGFSLLEAVVALAIVGLAVVAALGAFGVELRTAAQASRALEAEALAQSRLAVVRLLPPKELDPLTDSLRRGRFPSPFDGYQWETSSRSMVGQEHLFQVAVAVRWDQGAYSLATRLYRP
jgi:prepilin-type N-terminal cleavage/methylation domain-containing protein